MFLTPLDTSLKFEFHEELNEYYVTIVDNTSNEVIKEIPPKKCLIYMQQWWKGWVFY